MGQEARRRGRIPALHDIEVNDDVEVNVGRPSWPPLVGKPEGGEKSPPYIIAWTENLCHYGSG
jgi:hypothetical protein